MNLISKGDFDGDGMVTHFDVRLISHQIGSGEYTAFFGALQGEISGRRQGWVPAFNMLHVWLYKLNPCGVFAGIHPHVSVGFPEEPMARPLPEWFEFMGIANPYEDGGHH